MINFTFKTKGEPRNTLQKPHAYNVIISNLDTFNTLKAIITRGPMIHEQGVLKSMFKFNNC